MFSSYLVKHGDVDKAIALGEKALSIQDFGYVHATLNRAYYVKGKDLLFNKRQSEEALKFLELAVKHNPKDMKSIFTRAVAYYYVGNKEKDIQKLEVAKEEMQSYYKKVPDSKMAAKYLKQIEDRIIFINKMKQRKQNQ